MNRKTSIFILLATALTSLPVSSYPEQLTLVQPKATIENPQLNNSPTKADQLLKQGIEHFQANQWEAALGSWQEALTLYQELADLPKQLFLHNRLGVAYQILGKNSQAKEQYQQQLNLAQEIGDRPNEAKALASLGSISRVLGEYVLAIEHYQQSLQIWQELGDKVAQGLVLANLGNVYDVLGDYQKATELHQQSLEITAKEGNRRAMAISLDSLGVIASNQGNYPQARKYYQQALNIAREIGYSEMEVNVLGHLGAIAHVQKQFQQALDYYEQSLAIAQKINNQRLVTTAWANRGLVLANLGNYGQAKADQEQSRQLARESGDRLLEAIALSNLGYIFWKEEELPEAESKLTSALEILDSLRSDLSDADKISIFDTQIQSYNLLQQVLIAQNRPEAALEVAEAGRARAFVELLSQRLASPSLLPQIQPPTIEEIRQIAQERNATLVEYAIIPDEEFIAQGKLKGKNSELFIWVIQPTGEIDFRSVNLESQPATRGLSFQELVRDSRQSMGVRGRGITVQFNPGNQETAMLEQLHQLLIEPIADLLPKNPEAPVIFLPQGELFLLPFAALKDTKGTYLIEKHTILTAPAIQILGLTRQIKQERERQGRGESLVVGNPTMPKIALAPGQPSQQLPPLPGAEEEAKEIASLLDTKALIGDQGRKSVVVEKMPQARIIHLATHGLLDETEGNESAIALAPEGEDNGLLTAQEIREMNLTAELVVLSACDTGRGVITGDGVIGLSRSLITAGVPSVIVSLWAVPDAPTAELMTNFYENLQNNSDKARALQQAMLKTKVKYPNPRDWAAFTLIGEL